LKLFSEVYSAQLVQISS